MWYTETYLCLWRISSKDKGNKSKQTATLDQYVMGDRMGYKAVIFDLDGVICHTDKYHYQLGKKSLMRLVSILMRKLIIILGA